MENKQETEVKAEPVIEVKKIETQKKDHFVIVDTVFNESSKAHGAVDKFLDALGEYKGPVLLTMILSFVFTISGYQFLAQLVGTLMVSLLILRFILTRGDGAVREKANQTVDAGLEKIKEMKEKRELAKKNKTETK
jgi:hypothetical protein